MRRTPVLALAFLVCLLGLSCGGDSFKDDLTFGTGLDSTGMGLTGEATSFTVGSGLTLWFRFESAADFDGRFVRLYFNSLENKDFSGCAAKNTHICLSSFHVSTPGTYEVRAFLVKTNLDIGEETLVVTRTLTLQ